MSNIELRNLKSFVRSVPTRLKKGANKALDVLKEDINTNTPEDSKTLVRANKIKKASNIGSKVIWSVYNDTEYGKYVEYWVQGRTFNYHKPKWKIFKTGVGANMYQWAVKNKWKEINKIIRESLK